MKKIIVISLIICTVVIYLTGSSCGEKSAGVGPSETGCTFYSVPVADFTTEKTEYFVGNVVYFNFTGKVGGPDSPQVTYKWSFPGAYNVGLEKEVMNPIIQYKIAGTYSVACTINNGCWSNKKTKVNYITIKEIGK